MRIREASLVVVCAVTATSAAYAEPAWCKSAGAKFRVNETDWGNLERARPADAVHTLVGTTCFPNDKTKRDAAILAKGFELWSKRLGMTDADWADAAAMVADDSGSFQLRDYKLAWSAWSPIDQFLGVPGTFDSSSSNVDTHYVADALGSKLTEVGRAAYIAQCIHSKKPVEWAMCQADIDALDRNKLATELRGDTSYKPDVKMRVRFQLAELWPALEAHAAQVKEIQGKDPAYGQIFKLAANARTEWAKQVDPKLVELVTAMDDARVTRSRKASEGCDAATWEPFKKVLGAMPAKSFADIDLSPERMESPLSQAMSIVVHVPNGYLAGLAFFRCGTFGDKQDYLVRMLGAEMSRFPGFRGPRNAALSAIMQAGVKLDDRDAKLEYPGMQRQIEANSSGGGGGWGAVAKVTTNGATSVVSFASVKSTERQCAKGHETGKIRTFSTAGDPVYEYICEKWKTVTIDEPPFQAQTVKTRYVTGLAKGNFAAVTEDVVAIVYPKPGAPLPSAIAGVPLK